MPTIRKLSVPLRGAEVFTVRRTEGHQYMFHRKTYDFNI